MAFKSSYSKQLKKATNGLLNRKNFDYDFNADALYQQYKDQYMTQGNYDMRNAIGDYSANTGGYASSAAVAAGNSAYQANMSALNQKIPELYSQALGRYNDETQNMYNKYNMLLGLDQYEYQQYRDTVADKYSDQQMDLNRKYYDLDVQKFENDKRKYNLSRQYSKWND